MAHIFISYSHKDKAYVSRLYEALRARGFDAWIDDRIDFGTDWPKEIQRRLDACEALVLVMTPRAYESEWVHNELSRAQRLRKPVLPLLLEGDPWLSVESKQYVDVRVGQLPPENFYERLKAVAPGCYLKELPAAAPARSVKKTRTEKPKPSPEQLVAAAKKRQASRDRLRVLSRAAGIVLIALSVIGLSIWGIPKVIAALPTPQATVTASQTIEAAPTEESVLTITPSAPATTEVPALTYEAGEQHIRSIDGMVELFVPASESLNPTPFWVDQTEVTNEKYARCVQAGLCEPPKNTRSYSHDNYYNDPQFTNFPVVYLSQYMAADYCAWVGGRLPTNSEWVYAATSGDGRSYPWGDSYWECERSNSVSTTSRNPCVGDTQEVGSYPEGASPFGALDMLGNVWEWTATANASGSNYYLMGGSWDSFMRSLDYPNTFAYYPELANYSFGVRCVRDAVP